MYHLHIRWAPLATYSVDFIKRTVLLKVLFKIFNEVIKKIKKVSIKHTVRLIESTEYIEENGHEKLKFGKKKKDENLKHILFGQ